MKTVKVITAVIVLLLAGFFAGWWMWPKEKTFSEKLTEAKFSRPVEIDPHLASGLEVTVDGTDWLEETPRLTCGSRVSISVVIPNLKSFEAGGMRRSTFIVVPRLADAPEEEFYYHIWGVNLKCSLADPTPDLQPVKVSAGVYKVRFYVEVSPLDAESGILPVVHYLGERKLVVVPSEDQSDCGVIPVVESNTYRVKTE